LSYRVDKVVAYRYPTIPFPPAPVRPSLSTLNSYLPWWAQEINWPLSWSLDCLQWDWWQCVFQVLLALHLADLITTGRILEVNSAIGEAIDVFWLSGQS